MLKKTIKYVDYNGQDREEDFYFDLSEAELIEMDVNEPDGFEGKMKRVMGSHDGKQIMAMFKDFIRASYGEKSPDGKYFDKSEEISRRFEHTKAYNVLFMELCTDAKKAADFVSSVMPFSNDQRKEFDKTVADMTEKDTTETKVMPITDNQGV